MILGTGKGCHVAGQMQMQGVPLSFILFTFAPIADNGSRIRFIGRFCMEASPFNSHEKACPAKIPEIKRAVVPLLPTSSISEGAKSPCRPLPCTVTRPCSFSMGIPILRKQEMVERQSAPCKKLVISVVPSEIAPNIIARWEIDLSPGIKTVPLKRSACFNSINVLSFLLERV